MFLEIFSIHLGAHLQTKENNCTKKNIQKEGAKCSETNFPKWCRFEVSVKGEKTKKNACFMMTDTMQYNSQSNKNNKTDISALFEKKPINLS